MEEKVDFNRVPVSALRKATLGILSGSLNSHKVIPTDDGLPRDWRGLAHLIGLNGVETSRIVASSDPTAELISCWGLQGTVERLQQFLAVIDRFDVLEDSKPLIGKDVEVFMTRVTSPQISSLSISSELSDASILTVDDVVRLERGLEPQYYDAYLLFAEEDIDFASEIVDQMERQYNMKLCLRDRDLVGGLAFEHDAIMKLIAERCRRLLVVVTPSFLQSPANKFFVTFAQALGIDQRQRKVIPILYKKCELPPELSYYFLLNYSRAGVFWNFWEKLRDSIQSPDKSVFNARESPWMNRTSMIPTSTQSKPEAAQPSSLSLEPSTEQQSRIPPECETKKPLLKNITASFSNLVKEKPNKDGKNNNNDGKNGKKKWFGRKKVEPMLS